MAQIDKVRLPNGQVIRPTEWSSTPLYSSVEIAEGALTPLQAFSYGLGGAVPGSVGPRNATILDTNLQGDGAILPENNELLLYSLMVEFYTVNSDATYEDGQEAAFVNPPLVSARNMARMQRDVQIVLRIANTKRYADHPVGFFPGAMGVLHTIGAADNDNNGPYIVGYNGGVNTYDNREFATPHHVAPGEAFSVDFEFPSGQVTGLELGDDADARIRARVYADGYRRRPVA